MEKKKIVFLLGNGFSQGFGFPNMEELWDHGLIALDPYHKEPLSEAKKSYPLKKFIYDPALKNFKDIELLLTI